MSEENIAATVDVPEAPEAVVAPEKPQRESLIKEHGWSAEEADKAVERGIAVKVEAPAKPEVKEESKPEVVSVERRNGKQEVELTAEQEAEFKRIFGPGSQPHGLYVGMKVERSKRQQIEKALEQERQSVAAIRAELEALKKGPEKTDESLDDDDKPLTMRQIREMQKKDAEEREAAQKQTEERSRKIADAHAAQEFIAREQYPDFEDALKLSGDLAQNIHKLDMKDADKAWAYKLMQDFKEAAATADTRGADQLTAADIAYRLAQLHPNYGKKNAAPDGQEADNYGTTPPEINPKKGTGSLTPEQMKRLEQNTQRRASSASIPGNGARRQVAPEDVTLADVLRMPEEQRQKFKQKHPDEYARLRG